MDFYEGVVIDYIRADRALFVNPQCLLQLNSSDNPDTTGPHWYCDALAVDFRSSTIFLCEVSYGKQLQSLKKRLDDWVRHWDELKTALERDSRLPAAWPIRPWLFVPEQRIPKLEEILKHLQTIHNRDVFPRITTLEMTQPWNYCTWNRIGESERSIPLSEPLKTKQQ